MTKRMVFHHLLPYFENAITGSQVRPIQMARAFEEIGYEVEHVVGTYAARRRAVDQIYTNMQAGIRYDFVYSESATIPTCLTDPNHLPLHPFFDFSFFSRMRKDNVPVGLFLRDVHWRTRHFKRVTTLGYRLATVPFFVYDLVQYRRTLNHLFLPAMEMLGLLPGRWPSQRVSALPPGGKLISTEGSLMQRQPGELQVLYVGAVVPPIYDLSSIIPAFASAEGVTLTLCCREKEWQRYGHLYAPLPNNVKLVHASGTELAPLYAKADAILVSQIDEYQKVTVPIKYFESVGFGVPSIIVGNSPLAQLVSRESTGWIVDDPGELPALLGKLNACPECIQEKRKTLLRVQKHHTWESRASNVAAIMERYRDTAAVDA